MKKPFTLYPSNLFLSSHFLPASPSHFILPPLPPFPVSSPALQFPPLYHFYSRTLSLYHPPTPPADDLFFLSPLASFFLSYPYFKPSISSLPSLPHSRRILSTLPFLSCLSSPFFFCIPLLYSSYPSSPRCPGSLGPAISFPSLGQSTSYPTLVMASLLPLVGPRETLR